ncbi:MAG: hypothetical protein ACQEP5_01405 [Actinomycetota bacterium]
MALLDNLDFLTDADKNKSNLRLLKGLAVKNLSHAFLFSGGSHSCLYRLALAFAASINCPRSGCGQCRICKNTLKGVFANLLVIEAEGNFLLKSDVEVIKKFVSRTSNTEGKKIVIIKESETMNDAFANKFLKTLEEPPDEDCVFVLLAGQAKALLPTVVSRCMEIEWEFMPDEAEISCMDFDLLQDVLNSKIKKIVEGDISQTMGLGLEVCGILEQFAAKMKQEFKKEADMIRKTSADDLQAERQIKFLSQSQQRRLARFNKLGMDRVFDIIVAWLEDILAVKAGAGRSVLNYEDNYSFIDASIFDISTEKIMGILSRIEENRKFMDRSINSELALDSIFLSLEDALRGER